MATDRRQFLLGAAALTTLGSVRGKGVTDSVTVNAPAGAFRGRVVDDLEVFTGIPFGASTGGGGRFRPPRTAPAWRGVFDATRPAKIPPQPTNFLFPKLPGAPSEDCLQLNVWAPRRPGRYPVFVWMYGGGNLQGSCVEPLFDCAPFARDGIVAVNFNYRLGALGFLELGQILGPDYRGSANNAMLDQLLALQWVKRNISAFGGDPGRVTMAGQSAGASNLIALLSTPARGDLIQRAILASGTDGVQEVAICDEFAKVFMKQLGGVSRLHTASFDEILEAQGKAVAAWPYGPPFWAVGDPKMMPSTPSRAVMGGSARQVELMVGWCHDETRTLLPEALAGNPAYVPESPTVDAGKMKRVLTGYAKAYPGLTHAELIWKMTTAEIFVLPSVRIADAQAAAGGRVQTYRLDYTVPSGPFGNDTPHGFDVPMAFDQMSSPVGKFFGFSGADTGMAHTMHALWSSFVRTGRVDAQIPFWPLYNARTRPTMILERRSHLELDVTAVDRGIWRSAGWRE